MTKLTDMQLVLLTTAVGRADGSLLPSAESLGKRAARIRSSIDGLISKGLATEMPVKQRERSWRQDGAALLGVNITDAGRAAVGVEPDLRAEKPSAPTPAPIPAAAPMSKIGQVEALLQRPDGATLDELVAATGWLPHTTRAALTGLRKKGRAIRKGKRGELTCYTIEAAA